MSLPLPLSMALASSAGNTRHLHLAKLDLLQVVHHRQGAPAYGAYCRGQRTSSGP